MKIASWHLAAPLACALTGLLVTGCGKGHEQQATAAPPSSTASSPPAGSTLGVAGQLLTGNDPAAIRAYLQTVKEITPAKLEVTWNPATVAVDRDAAVRSLRAISEDGSDYTFASSEPVVATLKPGSILWIWDIAIRRVDSLATIGDATVAHTSPIPVTQIWTKADIEFHAPVSLPDYYMSYRPHHPAKPATQSSIGTGTRGRFQFAASRSADAPIFGAFPADSDDDEDWGKGTPATNGFNGEIKGFEYSLEYEIRPNGVSLTLEAKKGDADEGGGDEESYDEAAEKIEEANTDIEKTTKELEDDKKGLQQLDDDYEKQLAQLKADQTNRKNPDFEGPKPPPRKTNSDGFPLSDKSEQDLLTKQYNHDRDVETAKMQASQKIRDEGEERLKAAKAKAEAMKGTAKKLFEIASENLDVRFKARADLDNFDVDGVLAVANGDLEHASAQFKNLNGTVTMDFIGRMGDAGDGVIKLPLADVPIAFSLPIPMGGIPFMVQLGADFNLTLFLAGKHATMKFDGKYSFNGNGGFTADDKAATATSTISGQDPAVTDYAGMSPGVSGGVLGIQAPRIGLGLGLLGASSMAYIDVVNVMTMTNSAAVALGMAAPPCKRITYLTIGHVGVETNVLPLPIPFLGEAINDKLSTKMPILKSEKVVLDPPIKACEIK